MTARFFTSALAMAALAAASPALAQGRGGGQGQGQGQGHGAGGIGATMGVPGLGIGARGGIEVRNMDMGVTVREQARINSLATERASATAIANANENSVLFGSTIAAGPLTGLAVGTTIFNSDLQPVGTVERIMTARDGTVRTILVRSTDSRRMFSLTPRSLSLSGSQFVALRL
jgi:hypothetical protein